MPGSPHRMITDRDRPSARRWAAFAWFFVLAALAAGGLLYGFALVADPFGLRAAPGRPPGPLMDLNGRLMYPQLVRGGGFEGAVFGTSTIRLIDPVALGATFGGIRFANLGLNAGTPWEQVQLASMFLRHVPEPRLLVLGLDRTWCEPDADAPGKRVTFRSFPDWLYNEGELDDWRPLLSLFSLELAGRVLLHRLGLMPARIRGDGYEVFTPPDATYDLQRARAHLDRARSEAFVQDRIGAPARRPALAWLRELLGAVPRTARVVLLLPPIHNSAQAVEGSPGAEADRACKAEIDRIAEQAGAALADFRIASDITNTDANYWDSLHYRQAVAGRLPGDLAAAAAGMPSPDGAYRLGSGRR